MKLAHKKLGTWEVVEELTQSQVEAIFSKHHSLPEDQSPVVSNRVMLEEAIAAGVFVDKIDIETIKPAAVVWLSQKALGMAVDAITVPDEESKN